ncbi:MAG: XRE family transcriptional regulator, partial [Pseudonocardiaceae bacterium]
AVTPDVLGRVLSDTATDAMEFTQLTASSAVGQGTLEHLEVVVSDLNRAYDTAYLEAAQQHIGHISARHEGNDSSHPLAVSSPTTPPPPSSNTVMSPWGVVSEINPSSVEPIDEAFITSIHARIFELLALDAQVGGNETSGQALRLFRAVHRRIGVSPCPKRLRRDLYATVGELAEVAGWLFYDADQQDSMRRMNQEALYYLRWAGCRSLELLTLQNMSMQAEYLNRPSEAFTIVQSVLEADRLSPRMESLFLARGAHALAQQQQQADAVRTFQKARAFYLDGPRDDDPVWATWVDDRQFSWFEAMVQAELGEGDKSVHIFAEALATSPKNRVRGLYSRSVYLFESLVSVGDWREAEQLIPKLAPYISEVGSGRTASILRKTLHTVHATTTIPTLKDGAEWLRGVLLEGYKGADCRGCYSRRAGQGVV